MRRIWDFLTDRTVLSFLGVLLISAFVLLSVNTLELAAIWAIVIIGMVVGIWLIIWGVRRYRAKRASDAIGALFEQESERAMEKATPDKRIEIEALRKRMLEAIQTIKGSKLGQTSGRAALYELPWYIVIGNPAAGKSSAIVHSGLQFPFSDKTGSIVQGIGGTRNCDWFFTSEGILLDTAGRYSVHEEEHSEWLSFLGLLKKYRLKAPINGIIIAASIAEITQNKPEYAINLAKQLRQRVQELTLELGVFAPVYVVFTKMDLIAGFAEFFGDTDPQERLRVWGASLPYDGDGKGDAVARFDEHFDHLHDGVKEMSVTRMAMYRGEQLGPGVITFPLEFSSLRPALRSFIATLFEDNPFQFKPIFRGFYFTSARQEGTPISTSDKRITEQFSLNSVAMPRLPSAFNSSFFLKDLFSRVIFADRNLVRQYASRTKLRARYAVFFVSVLLLGLALGTWTWSYLGNQRLIASVQADMDKAIKLQKDRIDLASRLEALELLQDRIEQMQQYRNNKPLALGFGLYQGERVESKLREEYFAGVREVMLQPVAESLEAFLTEVNANADKLAPMSRPPQSAGATPVATAQPVATGFTQYKDASPSNVEDAYNALKTYLMLGHRDRLDAGHLNDQLTRFWRIWLDNHRGAMPREQMIRSAERLIGFVLSQAGEPDFPIVDNKLALVDQSREALRRVVRGMPARERVYAEIKARASTRFAPMTVARIVGEPGKDIIVGSHAIPGTFTRDAWEQYVDAAIKEAANKELQSADWVLKTAARDDLTLEGSPEQIQKALVQMYKTDYALEWQKFMQGISIPEFANFSDAVVRMNRLGDPANSPINQLLTTLYRETSWDNPSLVNQGLEKAQRGFIAWFKETILRQAPSGMNVNLNVSMQKPGVQMGPIGKEFAAIGSLVMARGDAKDASLLRGYLDSLSKVRTRFNQIKNAGDTGPASRQLMQQTLEGSGSELADALKFVDESMLTGMSDSAKATIRPLLVRPLIQAFLVIVKPTEQELNKTWTAQVYEPFSRTLAGKYPFSADSRVEASATEIGQTFGPDGAVSKFVQTAMGPLVVRRGDTLAARTWADVGINLAPEFTANFARYVAPPSGGASGSAASGSAAEAQTVFQIQPQPTPGLTEYSIEIDGQVLRYRNAAPEWTNFVWPHQTPQPGAKITGITYDGRSVEIANFPGRFGLDRLINSAQRRKNNGLFEMSWSNGGVSVSVNLRIISNQQSDSSAAASAAPQGQGLRGLQLPANVAGGV